MTAGWVGGDGFHIWSLGVCRRVRDPREATELHQWRPLLSLRLAGERDTGREAGIRIPPCQRAKLCCCAHAWVPQRNVLAAACGAEEKGDSQELKQKFPGTAVTGREATTRRDLPLQALEWIPWTKKTPRSPCLHHPLTQRCLRAHPSTAAPAASTLPLPVLSQSTFQVLQGQSLMCANLGISPNFSSAQRVVKLWNLSDCTSQDTPGPSFPVSNNQE